MPRSSNHCVHRNATIRPLLVVLVVVGVDVAVNNITVSSAGKELQKLLPSAVFVELKKTFLNSPNKNKH